MKRKIVWAAVLALIISSTIFQPLLLDRSESGALLKISLCEEKNVKSFGYDVRIRSIQVDSLEQDLKKIADETKGWYMDGRLLCTTRDQYEDPIILNFENVKSVSIDFYGQEGSGIVTVQLNEKKHRIDLFHTGEWKLIERNDTVGKVVVKPNGVILLTAWFLICLLMFFSLEKEGRYRRIYARLLPICVVITFAGLIMVYGSVWETNDDSTIAFLLSRTNNDYCPFIGHLIAHILQRMYSAYVEINWWLVVQLIAIVLGTYEVLHVLSKRLHPAMAMLAALSVCGGVKYVAIDFVNFTRTAILLGIGGAVLIADAVLLERKFCIQTVLEYLGGCVSLLLAQQIRGDGIWIPLGCLAAAGLSVMLQDTSTPSFHMIRKWIPTVALLWMVVGICVGGMVLEKAQMLPEENAYIEYNAYRSSIQDYPSLYKKYQENGSNLSKENLETFLSWYAEDMDIFNNEALKATAESAHHPAWNDMWLSIRTLTSANGSVIALALLATILLAIRVKEHNVRSLIAALMPLMVGLMLMFYLVNAGRLPNRVFQPLCFSVAVTCLALCGREDAYEKKQVMKSFCKVCNAVAVCGSVLICLQFYHNIGEIRMEGCLNSKGEGITSSVLEYINANPENVYFFSISGTNKAPSEVGKIWKTVPLDYCDNLFYLGGWTARMPYKVKLLAEYGITNPSKALLNDNRVYTEAAKSTTDFLRNNYGKHISISGVIELENMMFVQYTPPISDKELENLALSTVNVAIQPDVVQNMEGWRVTGVAPQAPNQTLYCNVTIQGVRYTYRLCTDECGAFSAFFYEISETVSPQTADLAFYLAYSN